MKAGQHGETGRKSVVSVNYICDASWPVESRAGGKAGRVSPRFSDFLVLEF